MNNNSQKEARIGLYYFLLGWRLIFSKGIKRYVILPIISNIVVLGVLFTLLFKYMYRIMDSHLFAWLAPKGIGWLSYIFSFLLIIILVFTFCYLFSTVSNLIAAPFNGLLAEKIEAKLTNQLQADTTVIAVLKDVPRIIKREMNKLAYYLIWLIPCFLFYFIPVLGAFLFPIVWFIFTAWMQAIQYIDYPFDNHKVPFKDMLIILRRERFNNMIFGTLISFFTFIPILNLVIMPIAVCGATAMWIDKYKKQYERKGTILTQASPSSIVN